MSDCDVSYDAESGCVTMTWRAYDAAAFRLSNERVLSALTANGTDRLLGEIENLDSIVEEDLLWLSRDWIPRAVHAGLRRVALVTPAFEVGHAGVLLVGEQVPADLELAYFDDRSAASTWLASGPAGTR